MTQLAFSIEFNGRATACTASALDALARKHPGRVFFQSQHTHKPALAVIAARERTSGEVEIKTRLGWEFADLQQGGKVYTK